MIIFIIFYPKWREKSKTQSTETGETFVVQDNKNEPDWVSKEVARRLETLVRKGDKLVTFMKNKSIPDQKIANRLYQRWKKLRTNPKGIREIAHGETSAAYTVNKGDEMRICIRDEKNEKKLFEEENTVMYGLIHEMAHLMSISYGHGQEFIDNFQIITKAATDIGVWKYIDYNKNPTDFCGTAVTSTII